MAGPRLWYVAQAHSHFPSTYANNVQVMKMCAGLAAHSARVRLLAPHRIGTRRAIAQLGMPMWEYYGVPAIFDIAWLPFPYPVRTLQRSMHALAVGAYALMHGMQLAYTRSEWVALCLTALGVTTILELHDFSEGPAPRSIIRLAQKATSLLLVTITRALQTELIGRGVPANKVLVAPDAVDLERFQSRQSRLQARLAVNLPADRFIVGYAGHLDTGQGVELLFDVAAKLADVLFVFAGGKPSEVAACQKRCAQAGLANVHFAGHLPSGRLPAYLYAADVLVMPYTLHKREHRYMSPMKMFEYMAAGRPIIASDFPVLREVLRPGENALLVSPGDVTELTAAVRRLQADPALGERLSCQALEDVKPYTWDNRAKMILAALERREPINNAV